MARVRCMHEIQDPVTAVRLTDPCMISCRSQAIWTATDVRPKQFVKVSNLCWDSVSGIVINTQDEDNRDQFYGAD